MFKDFLEEYSKYQSVPDMLTPNIAANLLVTATAILGNIGSIVTSREHAYKVEKLRLLKEAKSVAEARTMSEATEEYNAYREAEMAYKTLTTVIQTLKSIIRRGEEEFRNTPR